MDRSIGCKHCIASARRTDAVIQLQVRTSDRREIEAMVKRIAAVGEHFRIAHWREESGFPANLDDPSCILQFDRCPKT